jgi:hypothetical protein
MCRRKEQITFRKKKYGCDDDSSDNEDVLIATFSMCGHKQSFQSDNGRLGFPPCQMTHLFSRAAPPSESLNLFQKTVHSAKPAVKF